MEYINLITLAVATIQAILIAFGIVMYNTKNIADRIIIGILSFMFLIVALKNLNL